MNRYDSLTSVLWFLVGVGIALGSSMTLRVGSLVNPGSGFLPLLCGIFMACMAVIVFFQAPKNKREKEIEKRPLVDRSLINISILVITLLAFTFFLERLGFNITAFIVLFIIFTVVARTHWFIGLTESLIAIAACHLLFVYLLKIQLPKGWLRF